MYHRRVLCRVTNATGLSDVQLLRDAHVDEFRRRAFQPAIPAVFPDYFLGLPAMNRWFLPHECNHIWELNHDYLQPFGEAIVPLELTQSATQTAEETFQRFDAPLSVFLSWAALRNTPGNNVYLAQASVTDLPQQLRGDFPVPSIVSHADSGDIYGTNLWIGRAPTYTPLHRDPNPNIFVQLAGRKVVRLFAPDVGLEAFARVKKMVGGNSSSVIRGDEMMVGEERRLLEEEVWGSNEQMSGFEASLDRGDGLFIPKGWWHSIKGVGEGITGSVNWWFR